MKPGDRITQLFAFVVIDEEDIEGIPAIQGPLGPMPLVGADFERVESLRPVAKQIAESMGKTVRLIRFSQREEVEVFRSDDKTN